jgi:3-phenylpropionate/trans-cinnamate dioxygenase ferredoxin subunit
MTQTWWRVAKLSELEPEYPKRVEVGAREIALYLIGGTVYATSDVCSHAYARLSDGRVEDFEVICPLHGGSYDVRTGHALSEPCTEPIVVFDCRIEGDAVLVKVDGDE